MINRTEQDIIKNWASIENPVVSICCITFNHENYIAEAIDGFLMQETDFPFEILIHDDASTDRTADIIREYEAKYPNLIKPIYQTENQFSQGINPLIILSFPRAKGQFIALCEGDDYWVSKNKLTKQVTIMKESDDITLTFHDMEVIDSDGRVLKSSHDNHRFLDNQCFSCEEIINNWFISTQTIMLRKNAQLGIEEYFTGVINSDWLIQLICAHQGRVVFIDGLLAKYRKHPASLSAKIGLNKDLRAMKLIRLFMNFDFYSKHKYSKEIDNKIIFFLDEYASFSLKRRLGYLYYLLNPSMFINKIILRTKNYLR